MKVPIVSKVSVKLNANTIGNTVIKLWFVKRRQSLHFPTLYQRCFQTL
ncbi:hypothetical protein MGH68_02470 [Erysipelothrix sp. D19-032]